MSAVKKTPKIGQGLAGPGRPKGALNKTTALLKEAILAAGEETGEDGNGKDGLVGYCKMLATEHPPVFAGLLGKVLPLTLVDDANSPLIVQIIKFSQDHDLSSPVGVSEH